MLPLDASSNPVPIKMSADIANYSLENKFTLAGSHEDPWF